MSGGIEFSVYEEVDEKLADNNNKIEENKKTCSKLHSEENRLSKIKLNKVLKDNLITYGIVIAAFIIAFAINVWLNYSSYMNRTNPNNQNLLNEQSITVNHTINMEDYTGSVTGGGIFK